MSLYYHRIKKTFALNIHGAGIKCVIRSKFFFLRDGGEDINFPDTIYCNIEKRNTLPTHFAIPSCSSCANTRHRRPNKKEKLIPRIEYLFLPLPLLFSLYSNFLTFYLLKMQAILSLLNTRSTDA